MMDETERHMLTKLFRIRQILEETPGPLCSLGQQVQDGKSINKQRPGHMVGIFSMEALDPRWLKAVLSSSVFNETVKMTKYTILKDPKLKDAVSRSTFCIFLTDLFTWNITSSLEKNQELGKLGGKPLIVVIDDAENSEGTKEELLKNLSKVYVKDLFLFSNPEKKLALMKYTDANRQTDFMPSGKDPPVPVPATPNQDIHGNAAHVTHMMGVPSLVDPLVPVLALPNQDRYVSTQHGAHMMGVNTLALSTSAPTQSKPVSSYHAAHMMGGDPPVFSPVSTNKEGRGHNSHPAHTMGEELLGTVSPTSNHERFNNSSCPTQIVGKDLLLSIPSTARQKRCAKTYSPANVSPANVMDKYNNQELKTIISPELHAGKKHIVGIFSRSSDEDYSWLVELLTSEYFTENIQEVKPCYISNNGFQRFIEVLFQCTFGILYHTKNRGRVNITNVSDSLYDEELDYLEKKLGKDYVIVVIDDMEDNSDQEKTRILENQPDIERLANHLLLISHTEKAEKMQLVEKLKSITQLHHHQ